MLAPFAAIPFHTVILLAAVAAVAGLARGFSGFGGALIFVPAASALVGPAVAAPVLLIADNLLTLPFIPGAWRKALRREVAVMALGALLGVPLGTLILNRSDPQALRWAIAVIAFAMLLLLASDWRYAGTPRPAATAGVGLVSGLFGGLAQLSGPPVVVYWLTGQSSSIGMRANIILYFVATSVLSTVSYAIAGLLDLEAVALALYVGPAYGLGLYAGSRLFGRASELVFRRLCHGLIAVSVLSSLPLWG